MRAIFADTTYWIALFDEADSLHSKAIQITKNITKREIITSQSVLAEWLDGSAGLGEFVRLEVAEYVNSLRRIPAVRIIDQSVELFQQALELYLRRKDKKWGLTDCTTIFICQDLTIT